MKPINLPVMSNNSMDVKAKQRLCYFALSVKLKLVWRFAPRHLKRSAVRFS